LLLSDALRQAEVVVGREIDRGVGGGSRRFATDGFQSAQRSFFRSLFQFRQDVLLLKYCDRRVLIRRFTVLGATIRRE